MHIGQHHVPILDVAIVPLRAYAGQQRVGAHLRSIEIRLNRYRNLNTRSDEPERGEDAAAAGIRLRRYLDWSAPRSAGALPLSPEVELVTDVGLANVTNARSASRARRPERRSSAAPSAHGEISQRRAIPSS